MKIPHSVVTRTQPSNQPLVQPGVRGITPAAFGAGIGIGLKNAADAIKQRQEKLERFDTVRNFTDFELRAKKALAKLKQNTVPGTKNFFDQAETVYASVENEFLNNVPSALQQEFRARTGRSREALLLNAFVFDYEQNNVFFRQGIADTLDIARTSVEMDPSDENFAEQTAKVAEALAESDLSGLEKTQLAINAEIDLQKTLYIATRRNQLVTGGTISSDTINRIIQVESEGKSDADNPLSTAFGPGQFTQGTWRRFIEARHPELLGGGDIQKLRSDAKLAREGIVWYAQENSITLRNANFQITRGNIYLAHHFGGQGAIDLLGAIPGTSAQAVLGSGVITANPQLRGMTAEQAVAWAYNFIGAPHSDATGIDVDPRFDAIPYEDRVALDKDAAVQARVIATEQATRRRNAQLAQLNTILIGVDEGSFGRAEYEDSKDNGELNNAQDRARVLAALDKRDADGKWRREGAAKLNDPFSVWDKGSDDKKRLNALVGDAGLEALTSRDHDFVTEALVPLAQQAQQIPTIVSDRLNGMLRSSDQRNNLFALDTLRQLGDEAPEAFLDLEKNTQDLVDRYRHLRGTTDTEKMLAQLGMKDTAEATKLRQQLRDRGNTLLKEIDVRAKVLDHFDRFWHGEPTFGNVPVAAQRIEGQYRTHFLNNFEAVGNEDAAQTMTLEQLERVWGQTQVGGSRVVMEYPPEKVGLPRVNGSYDWLAEQLQEELGEGQYQLITDEQTLQEIPVWHQTGETEPSWMVVSQDENGVSDMVRNDDGSIKRFFFHKTDELQMEEELEFDRAHLQTLRNEAVNKLHEAMQDPSTKDTGIREQLQEELREAQQELDTEFPPESPIGAFGR